MSSKTQRGDVEICTFAKTKIVEVNRVFAGEPIPTIIPAGTPCIITDIWSNAVRCEVQFVGDYAGTATIELDLLAA